MKKKTSTKQKSSNGIKPVVSKSVFGGWIDIKKRKPKVNERVLLSNAEDEWVVAGHLATNGLWYNQFQDKHSDSDIIVTHWMKLPNPPKTVC